MRPSMKQREVVIPRSMRVVSEEALAALERRWELYSVTKSPSDEVTESQGDPMAEPLFCDTCGGFVSRLSPEYAHPGTVVCESCTRDEVSMFLREQAS